MLKYLLEKEFKQFKRNSFMPRLVIFMPCLTMLILPWAANFETRDMNLAVVDNDRSSYSSRLINKAVSSGYFLLAAEASDTEEALGFVESGAADIILEIPRGFERDLVMENRAGIQISANTVNGIKGMLGSSYLSAIAASFAEELFAEKAILFQTSALPPVSVDVIPNYRFNPTMNYKVFMIPALMVMLVTMICGFLPALNIVGEKETGTIEQINVTPVRKFTFIAAKLIPYWIMGFFLLNVCFLIAWLLYGLVPVGSIFTIYVSAIVYVFAVSGFGIVISNYSGTMQQAMFVIYFFLIILILTSGLLTPIRSMPHWAQTITLFNPIRYFIEIMRGVYMKGSVLWDISHQIVVLLGFAVLSNAWAVLSYRKNS